MRPDNPPGPCDSPFGLDEAVVSVSAAVNDVHFVGARIPKHVEIMPQEVHLQHGLLHFRRLDVKAFRLDHPRASEAPALAVLCRSSR